MNLWQVDDGGIPFDGQWCACYWAWGKDEVLQMAVDGYEYPYMLIEDGVRLDPEYYFNVSLVSDWPGTKQEPKYDWPHEEHRYHVLRQAGWREESDHECESCGLYTMGMTDFCEECWCCGECGCYPECSETAPADESGEGSTT